MVSQGGLRVKRGEVNASGRDARFGPPDRAAAQDIESDGSRWTQRLVVWRKGLAALDFFKNQLGLGVPSLDFAHRSEASAVQRGQPKMIDRGAVIGGRIAAVMLPSVARIFRGIVDHHAVAGDLVDNRCGGD